MSEPFVIAEVAQGYEGSAELARLLVRAASAAGADAVKFQVVFLEDLAEPGYEHADLFRQLELPDEAWAAVRKEASNRGIGFYVDVFGARSATLARTLDVDGVKLHSTTFFDEGLFDDVTSFAPRLLLSIGGIEPDEIAALAPKVAPLGDRAAVLYGFQAEPTPIEQNNLRRMAAVRDLLGVEVGFMDHTDGAGDDVVAVSAMALALGVTTFEKHLTLDRALELEDHVSALAPEAFGAYVRSMRRLGGALGTDELVLTEAERSYRSRALKRIVAARRLEAGTVIGRGDIRLSRPARPAGAYKPAEVLGRRLRAPRDPGEPIDLADLEG